MAMGMTRRGAWLRYGLVSVLLILIHVGALWFFSDGVYHGNANVPLFKFPEEVDVLYILTFTPLFIGLKYRVYDAAVRAATRNYRPRAAVVCFVAGYVVALAMDVACLVAASRPIADSGLSILGSVFQTPLVLLVAGALIAGAGMQNGRPPETGPAPFPGR
jgi:hypothetical protein